ncbi:DEAD/DEAH box helicase [Jeotgalibacillus haloalkalitolerans]|uniref:AAA domain-containing protein n=1 Tax=Jeotgalibacillus haloalkalitolerans TaxID=3104292 RepID=A0ABU5KJI0_9BACL|nr:AAA domain-containing protein [Jeotgalibacillus sp. HH7-29]MDZ5711340.1 AAA domain-containing protein [Jeotgalibacillus sp. HH7-29]
MNKINDILDAWITIEQLSEGSINRKDTSLKPLKSLDENWHGYFKNFLNNQKEIQGISDNSFKKSGLVLYLDIFNFQEVVEILRKKYKLDKTDEEISSSDKFTLSIYFDNELNFISDKFFYTMSGYIRNHGDLIEDFYGFEETYKEDLNREFSEDFNTTITKLFDQYKVSHTNFRYSFVKNLDNGDVNLHSFFIEDMNKAKAINNKNLNRYFQGFFGERKNLDGNKKSEHFNPNIYEDWILQPECYPLGRFPSNPEYALSFMQQTAVNLALNDANTLRSVNGPPGTGKTTLLKDIFADLVVQQAVEISQLSDKSINRDLVYYKEKGKFGALPTSISSKNIIVASSNNGAVQNIVTELPKKESIDATFQNLLMEADYFKDISNSTLSTEGYGKSSKMKMEPLEEENWGVFSLEGGAAANINKLLMTIEFIDKHLTDDYQPNPAIYQEFLNLHHQLKKKRAEVQEYYLNAAKLKKLRKQLREYTISFEREAEEKRVALNIRKEEENHKLMRLNNENLNLKQDLTNTEIEMETITDEYNQALRDYETIQLQKPGFLRRIFNRSQVQTYFDQLNGANNNLKALTQQKVKIQKQERKINHKIEVNVSNTKKIEKIIQKLATEFSAWEKTKKDRIIKYKNEVLKLEKNKVKRDIKEVDFSLSYEDLQKSNPWFEKDFRVLQSELFIAALKVRKQFLFENVKSLKAARIIWGKQSEYLERENGNELVTESWQWLNFAIPVVSTTFASFGRMFKNLGENSIGNLFVDEAGQALPQASVGAIFRSKKVLVVGDPSQIKPVLTLDSNVLSLIGRHHNVNEKFISTDASTQTIVDDASQYGFQKNEDEWIGIPLWVHRRSNYPMFTIANELSYDGLMVQGKSEAAAIGKSKWYDSAGNANDKFVKEQAELLKSLMKEKIQENPKLIDDIYVISPFRNVAYKLAKTLDEINFTKRENGKSTNVGTVHTFQGKEAKIVYFVLGADSNSAGAARWAVSDPNMMNVAATRAKEEFYVIGDKALYASLGSNVANTTISIIEDYNS